MNKLALPETNDARQDAFRRYLDRAEMSRRVAAAEWWVARHYLRGCRYFETIEYQTGRVRPVYGDQVGNIPFRYEELVNSFINEVGRLQRLDTRPSVSQVSAGLSALKDKATAQGILDGIYPYTNPVANKSAILESLAIYGSVGQYTYEEKDDVDSDNPQANLRTEVVFPWNLLGLPSDIGSPADAEGIARDRWVPLKWLKENKYFKSVSNAQLDEDDPDLDVRHIKAGEELHADSRPATDSASGSAEKSDEEDCIPIVHLYEIWVRYPNGRLKSYDIMVGKKLVHTKTYKNKRDTPMMPIDVCCRAEGVGFYGRSFVIPMVPLNAEVEAMLSNIFRQMQDFDVYGMVGIPQSWGLDQNQLSAIGPGSSRYFTYDPDPTIEGEQRIQSVQPVSNTNMLSSVASFGLSLLTRLGQQPEMLTQGDAPGRVDSEKGLNFLYQASTVPLGTIAASIARCYSTIYKKQLCLARQWDNFTINTESLLDDFAVIGLRFDHRTGQVDLSNTDRLDPVKVNVTIRSEEPIDKDAIKQDLFALLQQQLISPAQFKVEARLRGLDVPLPNESEWQNYRTAIIRNLILFGDGIEPGVLPMGMEPSEYDNPEIHLMVITRLMSSPEFALASPAVQEKFNNLIQMFQTQAGQYPDSLEYPEEAAELAQQQLQSAQGGMPQGGGAPMQGMEAMMGAFGGGEQPLSPQEAMF